MQSLREKYPVFTYESFETEQKGNDLLVHNFYRIAPDIEFHSTDTFKNIQKSIDSHSLRVFAFNIGLAQMFSYWKATCSPSIIIKAGKLNDEQCSWWRGLLIKGMGEYFYKNQIDFTEPNFVTVESTGNSTFTLHTGPAEERYLVSVGGGRDSAVTLGLFQKQGLPMTGFVINPTQAAVDLLKVTGVTNTVIVERRIDPKLFELNIQGFYNGHVPFSASIAFLSMLGAVLSNCRYIAVSNENSSNEANTTYLGHIINHQYSKTYEFEKKFREYTKQYLSTNIEYFSFLRPLSELQISKIFSKFDQYFLSIRSCNRGQKTNSWCLSCPKCLSAYILLYPFLGPEKIKTIFSENLFEKHDLISILESLIDPSKVRPFECVGTREEIMCALYMSTKIYKYQNLPALLAFANEHYLNDKQKIEMQTARLLTSWDTHHFLPNKLENLLREALI